MQKKFFQTILIAACIGAVTGSECGAQQYTIPTSNGLTAWNCNTDSPITIPELGAENRLICPTGQERCYIYSSSVYFELRCGTSEYDGFEEEDIHGIHVTTTAPLTACGSVRARANFEPGGMGIECQSGWKLCAYVGAHEEYGLCEPSH